MEPCCIALVVVCVMFGVGIVVGICVGLYCVIDFF